MRDCGAFAPLKHVRQRIEQTNANGRPTVRVYRASHDMMKTYLFIMGCADCVVQCVCWYLSAHASECNQHTRTHTHTHLISYKETYGAECAVVTLNTARKATLESWIGDCTLCWSGCLCGWGTGIGTALARSGWKFRNWNDYALPLSGSASLFACAKRASRAAADEANSA